MTDLIPASPPASEITTGQFFELLTATPEVITWLENRKSAQTRETYRVALIKCMRFLGIETPEALYKIKATHLIAWRRHLEEDCKESNRTINNRLSALSSLFKHLRNKQIVSENPVEGVERLKVRTTTTETPAFAPTHVRAMLDAPDTTTLAGARDSALLHTFAYTGCRLSEPTRLKVRDLQMNQYYWELVTTIKGGGRHARAIPPVLQAALRHYLSMAGHEDTQDAYLFQRVKHGKAAPDAPLSRQNVDHIIKKYLKQVLPGSGHTVHSFRATFITQALERGHPIDAVQKTVGHASMTTTQAYDKRGYDPKNSACFAVHY